jgi:hypothetical protein
MRTCELCGDKTESDHDGPRVCWSCRPAREHLVDKLGEQAFSDLMDIVRRLADNKARGYMRDHESEYDHSDHKGSPY